EATSIGISEEDVKKDVTILIAPAGEYRTEAKIKWADFTTKCKVDQDGALNYSLGHRTDIRGLSVASSNNAIVSGGGDELIIWNVHSLRPVACLRTEGMVDVTASVFAIGDGHVVAGTKTGELYLWDVAACELLESRKGHEDTVWAIVHTADGKGIITVSSDKKAKFWSYEVVSEGTQEKDYEARLVEEEDIVSGEVVDPEASLAAVKNTQSVVSGDRAILRFLYKEFDNVMKMCKYNNSDIG
ncbi:WD domain, G-beta repeat protein, partial [Ancylostoma duodenale]